MPTFLLPKLSENAAIAPVTAGQWEQVTITDHFLKGMSDGLAVAAQEKKTESIDSIPDIWARPILFKMALYDAGHKNFDAGLHEKVQGEWRALLAMFALQGRQHLPLTAEAVHLSDTDTNGALGEMMLSLAPKDSADGQENDWNDIYVISYNGVPLAITSPLTLIAAAADYSNTLNGTLTQPWSSDGKYLTDPLPYLSTTDLKGLYLWLTELNNWLTTKIPLDERLHNETCINLLKEVSKYMQDVKAKLGGAFKPAGTLIPSGLKLFIGLSECLDKKLQPKPAEPKDSAVLIHTSIARKNKKSLLLVSPDTLKDLSVSMGWPMEQLEVWSGITAVNINEKSFSGGKQSLNGVSLENAEWRRPEDFFTEHLAVQKGGNVFLGSINVKGSETLSSGKRPLSVILPFRQEILEYFTPQEIAQNCHIEKNDNEIKVQFTLILSGMNGKGVNYTIEKTYPMNEVIYLVTRIPVIEIWPNFKCENWTKYYLYYENSQGGADKLGRDIFYVYPWAYNQTIAGDTPSQGLMNQYTSLLSGFPEALICTVNRTIAGSTEAQPIEVGFVLLAMPQAAARKMGQVWKIGIDFGTSSTMLYYREGEGEPKPLYLKPNLFQVTDSGIMRNRTYLNFIPSSTDSQKTGSFLSIFQLLKHPKGMALIRPLQDGNVFWLSNADGDEAKAFCLKKGNIDANLKWKDNPVGKKKVAAYIEQICLQSIVEAVKSGVESIDWNFSYPTAFSVAQQMGFKNTCHHIVTQLMKDAGLTGTVTYWPESQASAYTFGWMGGFHFAGGAICLDIGAGTTDISIISGMPARIVYHTSLQFAGRYLFRPVYKNYEIFTNKTLKADGMSDEQRNALVDADLRKHSQAYLENLPIISGLPAVQSALQISQFALAGLFYYLGNLLRVLHERGIYQDDTVPDLYVGGNGSRILHWICGGNFDGENPYLAVFKDVVFTTSGLSEGWGFNLFLSKTPKVEVANGMVSDKPVEDEKFFDEPQIAEKLFGKNGKDPLVANAVFAGENFLLQNEPKEKTEFISAYDVQKGISIQPRQKLELQNFAEIFNDNPFVWNKANPVRMDNGKVANLGKIILGQYAAQKGQKLSNIFVEPMFILELKKFLEMIS